MFGFSIWAAVLPIFGYVTAHDCVSFGVHCGLCWCCKVTLNPKNKTKGVRGSTPVVTVAVVTTVDTSIITCQV